MLNLVCVDTTEVSSSCFSYVEKGIKLSPQVLFDVVYLFFEKVDQIIFPLFLQYDFFFFLLMFCNLCALFNLFERNENGKYPNIGSLSNFLTMRFSKTSWIPFEKDDGERDGSGDTNHPKKRIIVSKLALFFSLIGWSLFSSNLFFNLINDSFILHIDEALLGFLKTILVILFFNLFITIKNTDTRSVLRKFRQKISFVFSISKPRKTPAEIYKEVDSMIKQIFKESLEQYDDIGTAEEELGKKLPCLVWLHLQKLNQSCVYYANLGEVWLDYCWFYYRPKEEESSIGLVIPESVVRKPFYKFITQEMEEPRVFISNSNLISLNGQYKDKLAALLDDELSKLPMSNSSYVEVVGKAVGIVVWEMWKNGVENIKLQEKEKNIPQSHSFSDQGKPQQQTYQSDAPPLHLSSGVKVCGHNRTASYNHSSDQ